MIKCSSTNVVCPRVLTSWYDKCLVSSAGKVIQRPCLCSTANGELAYLGISAGDSRVCLFVGGVDGSYATTIPLSSQVLSETQDCISCALLHLDMYSSDTIALCVLFKSADNVQSRVVLCQVNDKLKLKKRCVCSSVH